LKNFKITCYFTYKIRLKGAYECYDFLIEKIIIYKKLSSDINMNISCFASEIFKLKLEFVFDFIILYIP